ncbi:MAG: YlbF family regulator [Clostridia bacterium]|nr:YlbF family regulator [Clostridia bacterium]
MDVIELTRQLGAAIQADEKYKAFAAAKAASDADNDVQEKLKKIEDIRVQYQAAAIESEPDESLLQKLDREFQDAYAAFMASDTMADYENARADLDGLMNYIMQILYLCVNGEDPATCEPHDENCGGDCGHCSGC